MTLRSGLLLFGLVVLMAVSPLQASGAAALTGTWDCVALTPDGAEIASVVEVKEEGAGLAIAVTIDGQKQAVTGVKAEGNSIAFSVMYQFVEYAIEGKVEAATLKGTWTGSGMSGEFRGAKRP